MGRQFLPHHVRAESVGCALLGRRGVNWVGSGERSGMFMYLEDFRYVGEGLDQIQ